MATFRVKSIIHFDCNQQYSETTHISFGHEHTHQRFLCSTRNRQFPRNILRFSGVFAHSIDVFFSLLGNLLLESVPLYVRLTVAESRFVHRFSDSIENDSRQLFNVASSIWRRQPHCTNVFYVLSGRFQPFDVQRAPACLLLSFDDCFECPLDGFGLMFHVDFSMINAVVLSNESTFSLSLSPHRATRSKTTRPALIKSFRIHCSLPVASNQFSPTFAYVARWLTLFLPQIYRLCGFGHLENSLYSNLFSNFFHFSAVGLSFFRAAI